MWNAVPRIGIVLCAAAWWALAGIGASCLKAADRQPNILFVLTDDLGWADIGCFGAKDIRTPRLDRLAREGVRFTQFYANAPECTPTRAAFLTGRYPQRVGGLECAIGLGGKGRYDDAARLAAQHELGLPTGETTLARLLKDAGYATAISGKWHLGYEDRFSPQAHGFEHAFYCIGGATDYYHHHEGAPNFLPVLRLNGAPVTREGYITDLIADDAAGWLRKRASIKDRPPFFLYVPFTSPHFPYQAPGSPTAERSAEEAATWQSETVDPPVYAGMIEQVDRGVGQILDALDELGERENTLVVFTSDNGGTKYARPTGLRGQKSTPFEGGIRVPAIVRWPGVLKAGSEYDHPAATFDLTASFARAAGVAPSGRPFDGIDILRHVAADETPPARALYWRIRRTNRTGRAVRDGSLKFVSEATGDVVDEYLFDLASDPAEKNNLLATRPADTARLKEKLAAWEEEVKPAR